SEHKGGCGIWLIFNKDQDSLAGNDVEETYPPRSLVQKNVDLSQRSIQMGLATSNTLTPLSKSPHRAASLLLESRFPMGLVAISPTGPTSSSTRLLEVVVRQAFQGKGFATEAAKAIIKYTFCPPSALALKSLFTPPTLAKPQPQVTQILSLVEERRSGPGWERVLEKLGMQKAGHAQMGTSTCDVYSLTYQDFQDLWMI
ncbi:hypothetical protein HDU91_002118, partial [Kappamyces sp. JEL0680]